MEIRTHKMYLLTFLFFSSVVVLRSLYPGLEGRFILETIKPSVMESLKKAAKCRGNVSNEKKFSYIFTLLECYSF